MKKKTTWAASVVKKQLQTCCKHQPAFSLETTERDDNTSQEIHISSPIKESSSNPVLLRRRSFTVSHARSLLTTPEPLTPFRKSVESAIPLCRSSTFKSGRLQNHTRPEEEEVVVVVAPSKPGKVLHKSGPLPVLQQLFRLQGASPLIVKKQLSGPLMSCKPRSAAPSPKQSTLARPSPQRLSKVKFSPIPHEIAATRKLADMIVAEEQIIAPPVPDRKRECRPVASSPEAKSEAIAGELEQDEVARCGIRQDHVSAAAVRIQAAFRGYRERKRLGCRNPAVSISTQMSRTDPQKQRKTPPPRTTRGWNGSMRSAQDHQALLRNRQEAAMKRERAMEYALSRQRWRTGGRAAAKGPDLDDRMPDKPGWVRSWLERASRMSAAQNSQNIEQSMHEHPQSESLSVKSTVGMCTTDIGSADVNLGWPLSLRQQHAAGLLQPKSPIASPPIETQKEFSTSTASSSDPSSTSELVESTRQRHDLESVGSCDGPVLQKLPSPVVAATKPRKLSNSNSLKRDRLLVFAQSQVSVALSDGDSADTTAASVQRPLWR